MVSCVERSLSDPRDLSATLPVNELLIKDLLIKNDDLGWMIDKYIDDQSKSQCPGYLATADGEPCPSRRSLDIHTRIIRRLVGNVRPAGTTSLSEFDLAQHGRDNQRQQHALLGYDLRRWRVVADVPPAGQKHDHERASCFLFATSRRLRAVPLLCPLTPSTSQALLQHPDSPLPIHGQHDSPRLRHEHA